MRASFPMKNLLPNSSESMKVPYFGMPISYGENSTHSARTQHKVVGHEDTDSTWLLDMNLRYRQNVVVGHEDEIQTERGCWT